VVPLNTRWSTRAGRRREAGDSDPVDLSLFDDEDEDEDDGVTVGETARSVGARFRIENLKLLNPMRMKGFSRGAGCGERGSLVR